MFISFCYTLLSDVSVYICTQNMHVYVCTHGCIAFEFRDLLEDFKNYNSIFSATDAALADHAVLFKNQFAMYFF